MNKKKRLITVSIILILIACSFVSIFEYSHYDFAGKTKHSHTLNFWQFFFGGRHEH